MRTTALRALLLDAFVAGTAATSCAGQVPAPAPTPPPTMPTVAPQPPPAPTAESPRPAPSEPPPKVTRYEIPANKTGACPDGTFNVLRDLKPSQRADYVELRRRMEGQDDETLVAHGQPCATAAAPDACHQALRETATAGFGSSCHPAHCDFYLVVTDASGVRRVTSAAELAAFTGPVDTPGEAFLLAFANGHWVLGCEHPAAKKVGKDWQFTTNLMIEECPIVYADVTLGVSPDGKVNVVRTANRRKTSMCVGRRPPGLRLATGRAVSPVSTYLGQCAHLEAASVPAFERLGRELETLGAPAGLARLCQRAARDERRHARVMNRLARAYGARAPAVELDATGARDAVTLAIDNAVEGCVRETFGALVGLHQASFARDVRVRRAMRSIARDEIRHAALSWKIAAWLEPRLSPSDRARVGRKRARAVSELRRESSVDPTADLCVTLGLPNGVVATRMVNALARTLWDGRS